MKFNKHGIAIIPKMVIRHRTSITVMGLGLSMGLGLGLWNKSYKKQNTPSPQTLQRHHNINNRGQNANITNVRFNAV